MADAMTAYPRYGLYFVPLRESTLYRLGSDLLGYDAFTGYTAPYPQVILDAAPDWAELTRNPRVYGFHATLKAPLSLAPGWHEGDLHHACENLAGVPRAIPSIELRVSLIDGFIALVPKRPSAALDQLARDCVGALDLFRAPLTDHDRARRTPATLTARQVLHLDRWGYPYVMEDFRFHMTLTGRLPLERQTPILALLQNRFLDLEQDVVPIDHIALCRQDAAGASFRIVAQLPLCPAEGSA